MKYNPQGCMITSEKYELGIVVDGKRFIIWTGTEFPNGMHDWLYTMTAALRRAFPRSHVESYQECNGERYSM